MWSPLVRVLADTRSSCKALQPNARPLRPDSSSIERPCPHTVTDDTGSNSGEALSDLHPELAPRADDMLDIVPRAPFRPPTTNGIISEMYPWVYLAKVNPTIT